MRNHKVLSLDWFWHVANQWATRIFWLRFLLVNEEDLNRRGYADWVSEIMLQQTQVATVISYYNKWMKKWPTLQDLAAASLEEVQEMWSGLGYYSRARRLHEGAQKVVNEFSGEMPRTADEMQKTLPGVGRYTARAIASIAFGEKCGVVDGNVIRVLTRMRCVGADSASQVVLDHIWNLADATVDEERPGDFNQALMEIGATVCTPKSPQCERCPVRSLCKAFRRVEQEKRTGGVARFADVSQNDAPVVDIECVAEACHLCLPDDEEWNPSAGVQNFPRKGRKKAAREARTVVCVLKQKCKENGERFLIVQRPEKGLLAGLWEFPSLSVELDMSQKTCTTKAVDCLDKYLEKHAVGSWDVKFVEEITHLFSHIHQRYVIFGVTAPDSEQLRLTCSQPTRWVTKEEFLQSAASTAMKKVFRSYDVSAKTGSKKTSPKNKRDGKKQLALDSFFKPKSQQQVST